MKVHELITLLSRCAAGSDVQIASGPMVSEDIIEVQETTNPGDICFLFGGEDPEIMDDDSETIGRLSDLIATYQAR